MKRNENQVTTQNIEEHKGKRRTLTILGYALMIVFLLIVLPVVLPPIFGYHTHTMGTDTTGNISKYGSVVYVKEIDDSTYAAGNIVAVQTAEGSRDVDVYYVDANDTSAQTLTVRTGDIVAYSQVTGKVVAKTPLIGYLSQLCFSVLGIIVTIVILAAGLLLMMYVNKISKEINQMIEDQKA